MRNVEKNEKNILKLIILIHQHQHEKNVDINIKKNTNLNDVINQYKQIINTFEEKPIIIGHSLGGLIAQKLANDGYDSKAIFLCSAAPKEIFAMN